MKKTTLLPVFRERCKSLKRLVRGGGLEPPSANDAEGSEEFDVIDISKLKSIDE